MTVETERELTIRDRMNFPYLIANQILTIQKAILNLQFSDREIREAVDGLVNLIPKSWEDKDFEEEMKAAEIIEKIDIRPECCGIKASMEYCKANGIVPFDEVKTFNYSKVLKACMNLLDRRGMLSKVSRMEQIFGEGWDGKPISEQH